jgi:hypothetical protein
MKKILVICSLVLFMSGMSLSAKCFNFSEGDGIKVCIDGTGAGVEKKAKEACMTVKGSKCGNVTGNSGTCKGRCVDASGTEHKSLKAD